jgi:hypothetical protein
MLMGPRLSVRCEAGTIWIFTGQMFCIILTRLNNQKVWLVAKENHMNWLKIKKGAASYAFAF